LVGQQQLYLGSHQPFGRRYFIRLRDLGP